jgi:hypothetical protein
MLRRTLKWSLTAVALAVSVVAMGAPGAAPGPAIRYELRTPGRVSLGVYDHAGALLRTLLATDEQQAGPHAIDWDGRDDAGRPLPAGDYGWRLVSTPGFSTEYLMSPGASYPVDASGPYWAQSPGCHGGPAAVAVDASGLYVGAFSENIETTILKQSLDGKARLWSTRAPAAWVGPTAMARTADGLWVYSANDGKVYKYASATGLRDGPPLDGKVDGEAPSDMAADDAHILLAYPKQGQVRWLSHEGREVRRIPVAGATAVDVASDGTVYVVSGTKLLRVRPRAVAARPLIAGLTAPGRAAINPRNGDIYVVEGGASHRIKRFSRTGALRQTYGRAGGRTDGLYQPQRASFRGVADIAVDLDGGFWAAEADAAPRRVAHFDRAGTWIAEWYGGQTWAPWIVPEPDDPRFVWMSSTWTDMMRLELDFTTKTWSVHSCYRYAEMADGLVRTHNNGDVWEARVHDGVLYLLEVGYPNVIKVDRTGWRLRPAAVAINGISLDPRHPNSPPWVREAAARTNPVSHSLLWTDVNGDGRALNNDGSFQDGETALFAAGAPWPTGPINPDHGFGYVFAGRSGREVRRFAAGTWTASGAPIYASFPAGEPVASTPARFAGPFDGRWSSYFTTDAHGRLWGAFNTSVTDWGQSVDSFVARYDADGRLAWTAGRRGAAPGTLNMLRRVYGVIDDCLVVGALSREWPTEGVTPVYVVDEDGLPVGPLLNRPATDDVPSWRYGLGGEALAGVVEKDARGDVYFFGNWINEARVYRISGWDGWERQSGVVRPRADDRAPPLPLPAIATAGRGTGLRGRYYTTTDWTGAPVLTRIDPTLDYTWNRNDGSVTGSPTGTAHYSVRWTGTLTPRRSGWHMFRQGRGGGRPARYTIDGTRFSDTEGPARAMWLRSGHAYAVQIDYTNQEQHPTVANGVLLQWAEPDCNGVFTTIPASQLMPGPP